MKSNIIDLEPNILLSYSFRTIVFAQGKNEIFYLNSRVQFIVFRLVRRHPYPKALGGRAGLRSPAAVAPRDRRVARASLRDDGHAGTHGGHGVRDR